MEKDFSKLSDEELLKIAGLSDEANTKVSEDDFSKLSDEELLAIANQTPTQSKEQPSVLTKAIDVLDMPRNKLVEKVGLPKDFKQTFTEMGIPSTPYKIDYESDLPEKLQLPKKYRVENAPSLAEMTGTAGNILTDPLTYLGVNNAGKLVKGSGQLGASFIKGSGKIGKKALEKSKTVAKDTLKNISSKIPDKLPLMSEESTRQIKTIADNFIDTLTKSKKPPALKPNYKEIMQATKAIGSKSVPGMLSSDRNYRLLENQLSQSPSKLAEPLRESYADLHEKTIKTAGELVQNASKKSFFEAGSDIKKEIINNLKEAENIADKAYEYIAKNTKNLPAMLTGIKQATTKAINKSLKFGGLIPQKTLVSIRDATNNLKTVSDIRELRTFIDGEISKAYKLGDTTLITELTKIRDSITNAIDSSIVKGLGKKEGGQIVKNLKNANNFYKDYRQSFLEIIPGKEFKKPYQFFEYLENLPEEKIGQVIFGTSNPKSISYLSKKFPASYKLYKEIELAKIADKALKKDVLSPSKIVELFNKMPKEKRIELLGKEGAKKLNNLETVVNNMTEISGPSGTPAGLERLEFLKETGSEILGGMIPGGTSILKKLKGDPSKKALKKSIKEHQKEAKNIESFIMPQKKSFIDSTADSLIQKGTQLSGLPSDILNKAIFANRIYEYSNNNTVQPSPMDEFNALPQANKYLELADKKDVILGDFSQQFLAKYPPFMQEKIKGEFINMQGAPTLDKIMKTSLPKPVKEDLLRSLERVYKSSSQDEGFTFIPQEKRSTVRQDIENNMIMSVNEKAKLIDQLNRHGGITNIKAITGF